MTECEVGQEFEFRMSSLVWELCNFSVAIGLYRYRSVNKVVKSSFFSSTLASRSPLGFTIVALYLNLHNI